MALFATQADPLVVIGISRVGSIHDSLAREVPELRLRASCAIDRPQTDVRSTGDIDLRQSMFPNLFFIGEEAADWGT